VQGFTVVVLAHVLQVLLKLLGPVLLDFSETLLRELAEDKTLGVPVDQVQVDGFEVGVPSLHFLQKSSLVSHLDIVPSGRPIRAPSHNCFCDHN
jgi:hypothetical protein